MGWQTDDNVGGENRRRSFGAGPGMAAALRWAARQMRRAAALTGLFWLLYWCGLAEFTLTPVELAVTPYRYSIVDWETSHLPDKWLRRVNRGLGRVFASGPSEKEEVGRAREFFRLRLELNGIERELRFPELHNRAAPAHSPPDAQQARAMELRRGEILERLAALQGEVEETIESRVSRVAAAQGVDTWAGVFPPVDVVFTSSPHLLVMSPRDRIVRQREFLLEPGLGDDGKESLERRIGAEEPDMSVYVADTGGLSVYPAVVSGSHGLRNAVEITAHEWLHSWFFIRPLGRNFWTSGEMASLNETVATVAGAELGGIAYAALTGEPVELPSAARPPAEPSLEPPPFDFRAAMQETRKRVDALLAEGRIEEAEAYMEKRRQVFASNGYLLRKLNQAYFAFHGTYATSAASVSPIGGQVRELRERSASLGEFLHTVAGFGSYAEFVEHLEGLRGAGGG